MADRFCKRITIWGCLLLGGGLSLMRGDATQADKPAGLREAWALLAEGRPIEAQAALSSLPRLDPRERLLAESAVRLARPPVAEDELRELIEGLSDLADGRDEIAAAALYLKARIYQVHLTPTDYDTALAHYRQLVDRQPASHWAQLGLVKMGLIQLYALPEPAETSVRLREVEGLLPAIVEPDLKRDLRLQIGWAGLFYEQPIDEVLPHLMAADEAGGLPGVIPEDLVLQIAELSMRAGHLEQSRVYFERFLREHATSLRRYNVQQRLAELMTRLEAQRGL